MDILGILEKSGKDLYPEDLDFFETELATGGIYDAAYQAQCRAKIKELRSWFGNGLKTEELPPEPEEKKDDGELLLKTEDLGPETATNAITLTPEQKIISDLTKLRDDSAYKTKLKQYVKDHPEIDADFVDAHYAFFRSWELDAVISVREMPEEFLEKFFGALDHDKIARYQQFSESFFMKHFAQMNPNTVLMFGKNEWRKKENRSKQLDVFLRLKGVKI